MSTFNFTKFIKSSQKKLVPKKTNHFRLVTFNVHYWTDSSENVSMRKIIRDIKKIDADVLFLQEVIFGHQYKVRGKLINTEKILQTLSDLGYFTFFCNTLPTQFGGIFGNMMCVKKHLRGTATNYTFQAPKNPCVVSSGHVVQETRCFILLQLLDYVIVGVHLDVCSEAERKNQIKFILKKLDSKEFCGKRIIILGDFNSTDIKQYKDPEVRSNVLKHIFDKNPRLVKTGVLSMLSKNSFVSAGNFPVTTWSGIQVDYIFYKNIKKSDISVQILYSDSSDHLPIIADILKG